MEQRDPVSQDGGGQFGAVVHPQVLRLTGSGHDALENQDGVVRR